MSAPARLCAFRQLMGWSEAQLGAEIGVHQASVSKLMTGARRPSLRVAHAIERLTAEHMTRPILAEEWLAAGAA